MGTEAHGKTIGIVGIGNVGRRIAELCSGLLGMKVLAYDPYLAGAPKCAARGAEKVDLDELLRRSDYVSINCPLTKESRGMIGAREFSLMQPHAYFITTARGCIHDEAALPMRCATSASPAPASTSGPRNRRRRNIRCCSSTTCWPARTPPASPTKPGKTWAGSPPSSFLTRSTASGRRGSSTRKSGPATASVLPLLSE